MLNNQLTDFSFDSKDADGPIANRVQAWTVGAVLAFTTGWDGGATTSPSGGPRSATSTTSHS